MMILSYFRGDSGTWAEIRVPLYCNKQFIDQKKQDFEVFLAKNCEIVVLKASSEQGCRILRSSCFTITAQYR